MAELKESPLDIKYAHDIGNDCWKILITVPNEMLGQVMKSRETKRIQVVVDSVNSFLIGLLNLKVNKES